MVARPSVRRPSVRPAGRPVTLPFHACRYDLDPHRRPTSLHNCASNPLPAWRGEAWYSHVTLQQGHGITSSPVDYWLAQYNADPPRVVVEDEANYELLKYGGMTNHIFAWLARQSAWCVSRVCVHACVRVCVR